MTTVNDGRRRYEREHGTTPTTNRFASLEDTPINRGRLRKLFAQGDSEARDRIDQWDAATSAPDDTPRDAA